MDKLFFGEIEAQAKKANAEKAKQRGSYGKGGEKSVGKAPMKAVAQKNEDESEGSY